MTFINSRSGYWRRRVARHITLAVLAIAATGLIYLATAPPDFRHRFSMATAYSSLLFLCATLILGPWNTIRNRPNPVSYDLRRDLGIWSGLLALLHTGVGLTVHLRGRMYMYFIQRLHPFKWQRSQFGAANDIGLISALLFLVLLAISNDLSLRTLGLKRWKSLQRWTYIALGLAIVHGVLYQLVEKRHLPWVLFYAIVTFVLIAAQLAGVVYTRIRLRQTAHTNA